MKSYILKHLHNNKRKYLFFISIFIFGIIIGGFFVYFLNDSQLSELIDYMQSFFNILSSDIDSIDKNEIFKSGLLTDFKSYFILWILGFSVFSRVYVPALIFFKGFILGFTNTFLVNEFAGKGILFITFGVLPQSLIKIMVLMVACNVAISFYTTKNSGFKGPYNKRKNYSIYFSYSFTMLLLFLLNIIGIFLESYIIPLFMFIFSPGLL